MKLIYLLAVTLLVAVLISDVSCWRRRRRRRRTCSPVACASQWSSWSSCDCSNAQTRTLRITRNPSCNGAGCPAVRSEMRKCSNGQCVAGSGVCLNNGRCQCNPGKRGSRCELNCAPGTYGQNCAQRCSCAGGASCDSKDGFCKCPVGRSGKRCQFSYRCQNPRLCFNSKNPVVNYRQCFVQAMVSTYPVSVRCPRPTHYINKCACYRNCIPVQMSSLGTCRCYCRNPYTSSVPASLRGKYVTYATCCPMTRYWF